MASCKTREAMVADIAKRAIVQIKKDNPTMVGKDIRAKANEVAEAIVVKSEALSKEPITPEATTTIRANATTMRQPVKKDRPVVAVPKDIQTLHDEYTKNPSNNTMQAIINRETAHGFRNNKGEILVTFKQPILGSSKTVNEEMTGDEFAEAYENTDGTISKATALNNAFIAIDKKNNGENYSEAHSEKLTSVVENMQSIVKEFQDIGVKITPSDINKLAIEKGASGHYNPNKHAVLVAVDEGDAGAKFRTRFSMGNQEAYVHEMVHAVMDFMFADGIDFANEPKVVALRANLQELYTKAMKESTWKTLLPGYDEGVTYTPFEEDQARDKWDYIFNNDRGTGLHEFMAGIITNDMFREGMEAVGSLNTKEAKADESIVEMIRRVFMNMLEKVVGFASNKRDKSVTSEGTRLIFDIMKAHNNAVDKVAGYQVIQAVSDVHDKLQDKIDITEESIKKITMPIIGVLDEVTSDVTQIKNRKGESILDPANLKELVRLTTKISDTLTSFKKTSKSKYSAVAFMQTVYDIIRQFIQILRVLPAVYKLRKLIHGTKASRDTAKLYSKVVNRVLEGMNLTEQGMVRNMIGDFMDKPGVYNHLANAILKLTHDVDGMRQHTYEGVLAEVNEWFGDVKIGNNILNMSNNEGLTDVILRTDIQSLGVDAKGLHELLSDPAEVAIQIAKLKKGLTKEQIADVNSLAAYMITGNGNSSNATNIARGFGHDKAIKSSPESIAQIDKLVSLRALELVEDSTKDNFIAFLEGSKYNEYSTTLWAKAKKSAGFSTKKALSKEDYIKNVDRGVNGFIDRAIGMQEASKGEMRANPHERIKGYIKETYKTDYTLEYHPITDKEKLVADGFKFVKIATNLPGSTVQYGMFISNVPEIKRANGALGLQDMKARGFSLRDIVNKEAASSEEEWDKHRKDTYFKKLFEETLAQYKTDRKSVGMQPIYNNKGRIVSFRATMSIEDKKQYLDLETRGTENLARSFSTMGTATATASHNRSVVDMLKKDYDDNYVGNEERYIVIEPQAFDKIIKDDIDNEVSDKKDKKKSARDLEIERFWARLPSDTKAYAEKLYGSKQIILKKDVLTVAFGEDNYSITQSVLATNMSEKTKARLRKLEDGWQDIMQISKANIVIKTPEVLFGNIFSNFKILMYVGVQPQRGLKLLAAAKRDLAVYETARRELEGLKRDLLNPNNKVNKGRIAQLENEIKANSVTPLVEAGLYQSVVEDVDTAGQLNRTASWFDQQTDKYITNETANSAIQHIFMTQKTKPYQQLMKATQVSDFYFRYAQYYDALDKGTSQAKALKDATDNFINYEVPLEKHVRYGDAMGPWFFVKYFVKIQRVVKKFVKEHPLRVGIDIALQQFVTGDTPDVLDASVIDKGFNTYNPFKLVERFWEVVTPSGLDLAVKTL